MLPIDRQKQILTWLENEKSLRVTTISQRLDVSEMTVYRDLNPLIKQNKVIKTSSGVTLSTPAAVPTDNCPYCLKPSSGKLSVQIIKENQQIENACCAHCALMRYQDIKNNVSQVICRDFLKDTTINAKAATFLIDADLDLNCCEPQPIIFASRKQAKQFQKGFGGKIYNFQEAIQMILKEMKVDCCCCEE
ncbi:DeoR family transcriptional regulator [Halobacillus sp. A5]|uniref:DeoR family transcriptional regulator n=1 Tax=Halobacillus sp. A5 TaxID=2880263 RepID=UPI0020A694D8|nr:DeoR family transcriptional regulator [Halobacillus sp. A5]